MCVTDIELVGVLVTEGVRLGVRVDEGERTGVRVTTGDLEMEGEDGLLGEGPFVPEGELAMLGVIRPVCEIEGVDVVDGGVRE